MLVLGIDPGLATTGYGLVASKNQCLSLVNYGVLETSSKLSLGKRLQHLYRDLGEIIEQDHPEAVAVEELFFSRNVRTAMIVGQARGVVLLAAAESGLPLFEYTPLQVKDAVVGYGRATKAQVQEMVRLLLGMDSRPRPDDAADAIAVAICHIHSARMATLLNE